ncbi:MAG: carboxypeptidase regulatory-like domain-containing protein [Phycisphaerae bacterium]|jgi:beta-lactamase regulating signal transducer with metallopeptidase domain/ankyrin repeat protein
METLDWGTVGSLGRRWLPILLDASIKGLAIVMLALAAVWLMRRRSAAARGMVLSLAMASLLVLPVLSHVLPSWAVLPGWAKFNGPLAPGRAAVSGGETVAQAPLQDAAAPIESIQAGQASAPEGDGTNGAVSLPMHQEVSASAAPVARAATGNTGDAARVIGWLMLIWAAGAVACLMRVVLGTLSLWRLERRSRRISSECWVALLASVKSQLGITRPVALLESDRREMPMVWGLWPIRLLVPAEATGWSAQRRRAVLLHELAHARRYDGLAQTAAGLACAVYWFNPLAWLAFGRLQNDAETACDDLVLAAGARPSDYAEFLLEIAAGLRVGPLTSCGSIAMARPSQLEGRMLSILDPSRSRRGLTRLGVIVAVLLVSTLAVTISCMKASPSSPRAVTPAATTQPDTQGADPRTQARGEVGEEPQARNEGEPFTWTGKVVDANDKPLAGVTVAAYEVIRPGMEPTVSMLAKGTTGDDGLFSLTVPDGQELGQRGAVVAWKQGMVDWCNPSSVARKTAAITFVLREPKSLGGVIFNEAGKPVAGATVTASLEARTPSGVAHMLAPLDHLTCLTDEQGRFVIAAVPPQAIVRFLVSAPGYARIEARDRDREVVATGIRQDIKIILPTAARAEGVVLDKRTGTPVAGASLYARMNRDKHLCRVSAVSDANGRFVMEGLTAGQGSVSLTPPMRGTADWAATEVKLMTEAGKTSHVTVQAEKGGLVEASVVDEDGKKVPNASVIVRGQKTGGWGKADANGLARIRLLSGEYRAVPEKEGFGSVKDGTLVKVVDDQTAKLTLQLPWPQTIKGRVQDANGQAVGGASLQVVALGSRGIATADANGAFAVVVDQPLQEGEFTVVARDTARNLAAAIRMSDANSPCLITMEPGSTVTGRVTDAHGKPIADACIDVNVHGKMFSTGLAVFPPPMTDSDGRFSVKALPSRTRYNFAIDVDSFGRKESPVWIDARPGRTIEITPVVLSPANLTVAGTVIDESGKPVLGAGVNVNDEGATGGLHAKSDANGRFAIDKISAGPITVDASVNVNGQSHSGVVRIEARPGMEEVAVILGQDVEVKLTGDAIEQANRNTSGKLDRIRLSADFDAISFGDATQYFRDATGIPLAVSYRALGEAGVSLDTSVKLRATDVPAGQFLQQLLRSLGGSVPLSYRIAEGRVMIETSQEIHRKSGTASQPAVPATSSPAASQPATQAAGETLKPRVYDVRDIAAIIGSGVLERPHPLSAWSYAGPGAASNPTLSREEMERRGLEHLMQKISKTFAPKSWKGAGGEGKITPFNGSLFILQTEANHKAITKFIEHMREAFSRQVRVEARFIALAPQDEAKALQWLPESPRPVGNDVAGVFLTDTEAAEWLERVSTLPSPDNRRLAAPAVTLLSGTSANVYVGEETAMYLPSVDSAQEKIRMAVQRGAHLGVAATVSADLRVATLELSASVVDSVEEGPQPVLHQASGQTTLNIPDGVPILLRIPYANVRVKGAKAAANMGIGGKAYDVVTEPVDRKNDKGPRSVLLLIKPIIITPQPATQATTQPAEAASQLPKSGIVIQRTLGNWNSGKNVALDLETGRLYDRPEFHFVATELVAPEMKWWRQEGLDVRGVTVVSAVGSPRPAQSVMLQGLDMVSLRAKDELWNASDAEIVAEAAKAGPRTSDGMDMQFGDCVASMHPKSPLPAVYAFRTREGASGVIRLDHFDAKSNGVTVSYRLCPAATTQPATQPATQATPPVHEDVQRLQKVLARVVPDGWELLPISQGHVVPFPWPGGEGIVLRFQSPYHPPGYGKSPGGRGYFSIWIMNEAYGEAAPPRSEPRQRVELTQEMGRWRGRRVFSSGPLPQQERDEIPALLQEGLGESFAPLVSSPLHNAAAGGHGKTADELMAAGFSPNARDGQGRTPLHLAACGGHQDVCERLLKGGADINAADRAGQTALDEAARRGHVQLVRFLIDHGAKGDTASQPPQETARGVSEVLPRQVAKLTSWPTAERQAGRVVQRAASEWTVRAHRNSIEWIERVIDPRWLPENPNQTLGVKLVLLHDADDGLDTSHVEWEKNGYRLRVSQTETVFYLDVTPAHGKISEGDANAKRMASRDIASSLLNDVAEVKTSMGDGEVNIATGGTKRVLLASSFDAATVKQLDDGIVAVPGPFDARNPLDCARLNFWWYLMGWWTNGQTLGLFTLKTEGGAWLAGYGSSADARWFAEPPPLVRRGSEPSPSPTRTEARTGTPGFPGYPPSKGPASRPSELESVGRSSSSPAESQPASQRVRNR